MEARVDRLLRRLHNRRRAEGDAAAAGVVGHRGLWRRRRDGGGNWRALDAYVALGRRGGILAVLDGLAAAMVARGTAGDGVCLMAATERLRTQIDVSISEQETLMRHAALEHARQLLTQDAWQAAWRQGESLDFARAVALAQSG